MSALSARTLFRFVVTFTEYDHTAGCPYPATRPQWAPDARTALKQAIRHLGGKGFISLDEIDPDPTHVRQGGMDQPMTRLSPDDYTLARATLAEQSGCTSPAEMLRFLAQDADAYGKRLLAEVMGDVPTVGDLLEFSRDGIVTDAGYGLGAALAAALRNDCGRAA